MRPTLVVLGGRRCRSETSPEEVFGRQIEGSEVLALNEAAPLVPWTSRSMVFELTRRRWRDSRLAGRNGRSGPHRQGPLTTREQRQAVPVVGARFAEDERDVPRGQHWLGTAKVAVAKKSAVFTPPFTAMVAGLLGEVAGKRTGQHAAASVGSAKSPP